MLQRDEPSDYVHATGVGTSVRDSSYERPTERELAAIMVDADVENMTRLLSP